MARLGRFQVRHGGLLCLMVWCAAASGIARAEEPQSAPASAAAPATHSAVTPTERTDEWHRKRFAELQDRVQAGPYELVFLGDSITQGWEGAGGEAWKRYYAQRKALNLGIGGDRTQHVLWRLDNGNFAGLRPKVLVLMIGTNNSNGEDNSVAEIYEGVRAIVASIRDRSPETRILLLDIFPRGQEPNPQRGKNCQVNQLLPRLADGKQVHFLAIGHLFLDERGGLPAEIMPDALHLSPRGYEIWAEAIEPKLRELLDESR